jgi:choline dehydrogenase-like flavoprotein
MELDARTLDGAELDAEVCVVGAGPAGLVLARELAARRRRVVVLESGGRNPDASAQALAEGTTSGDACAGPAATRIRRAGGTAHAWNTRVEDEAGAKYVPLDAPDLEARAWWPLSGWPLDRGQLDPYYARAQALCGLGRCAYRGEDWATTERPCLPLSPDGPLTTGVYQLGPARLFTGVYLEDVRAASGVLLCLGATAVALELDAGGRSVAAVRAAGGRRGLRVRAARFVLAAGGIENARLLLLAQRQHGVADASGLLGRGFMEHPRDLSLRLVPTDPGLVDRCRFYDVHRAAGTVVLGRLALTDEARRRLQLPAMSITLLPRPREWRRRAARWLRARVRGDRPPEREGWAARPHPSRRFGALDLLIHLEQAPDPDNRVALGSGHDRFGLPQPDVHWRWRPRDQHNLARVHALVAEECRRQGLGEVAVAADGLPDPNAHHHMGTTRMHDDPRRGVVDAHGRVHALANLHVAGSSLFPTGGFANPTLTIVALALRLADHLHASL